MAACLVTTGGTAGTIRLDYDLVSNHVIEYFSFDDTIWIDDTADNVTYTTLTGDVTASSGCVTITERPIDYWVITYDRLKVDQNVYDPKFDAILIDATVNAITPNISIKFAQVGTMIAAIDNTLDDDNIKITAYKFIPIGGSDYYTISYIFRIIGGGVPSLRIKSPYNNYSFLKATSSVALPDGYTAIDVPISPTV